MHGLSFESNLLVPNPNTATYIYNHSIISPEQETKDCVVNYKGNIISLIINNNF